MSTRHAAERSTERAAVMRNLLLDVSAARAFTTLQQHGIAAIVLKGRAIASWLYPGELRPYGDVDLLVAAHLRDHAVAALATLGYRHWLAGADTSEYGTNEIELIGPNGVCIDLHHTLLGVTAPAARCWEVLARRTETTTIGGGEVTVLDQAARTMHLALHVAQNGPADVKATADLARGLDAVPTSTWREAAAIAESIGAVRAFAAGLRVVPPGVAMAHALALRSRPDVGLVLRTGSAPSEALMIQRFIDAPSRRARIGLVLRKLWPTAAYMAARVPAGRHPVMAVAAARLWRLVGLPGRFRIALRSWREANRIVRTHLVDEQRTRPTEKDCL
jgi:hypothetical protein